LIDEVNRLQEEKHNMEVNFNRDLKAQAFKIEEERRKEIDKVTFEFQQKYAVMSMERDKLKQIIDQKSSEA
jgi:hypothetical protein